jgi:hypothetical protein
LDDVKSRFGSLAPLRGKISKQKSMKKNTRYPNSNDLIFPPAFPLTGPQIFQYLRATLTDDFGFEPSISLLASILGEQPNLTHYWFKVLSQKHVIAFLILLEQLPEPRRRAFLNECCRELPRLDNPRLAHDPLATSLLENLLQRTHGLTLIQGGTTFQRTFLVNALGHSFPRLVKGRHCVTGLDVQEPKKWVPNQSMIYLKQLLTPARVEKLCHEVWPAIRSSDAAVILLNGVWTAAPKLQSEILKLSLHRNVFVTVSTVKEMETIQKQKHGQIHKVTIEAARESEQRIRITVEAL